MTSPNLPFDDPDSPAASPRTAARRLPVPAGYVGEYVIPGSGRRVWWTGRVAIGLLYRSDVQEDMGQSAAWIQDLLLKSGRAEAHRH